MTYPDPPNLNWMLVALLSFLTCGIFTIVWNLMLSSWVRRVLPATRALTLYVTCYAILLVNTVISTANSMPNMLHAMHHEPVMPGNIALSASWA